MLHAIADHVVDDYLAVVDAVQDDIDEVETDVFAGRAGASPTPGASTSSSASSLELKRAVARCSAPLQQLAERPMRLVDPEIQEYFRDVADHLLRVTEQIDALRRAARPDPPGQPGAGHRRAERGHAQDLGLGRDRSPCRR